MLPLGTTILPSFIVRPVSPLGLSMLTVTLSLVAGLPLSLSLPNTSTSPPVLDTLFSPSSTASMLFITLISAIALSTVPQPVSSTQ